MYIKMEAHIFKRANNKIINTLLAHKRKIWKIFPPFLAIISHQSLQFQRTPLHVTSTMAFPYGAIDSSQSNIIISYQIMYTNCDVL